MIVGIFHPCLNFCGGAEWVAVNLINSVKEANHQTIVLTNESIDQDKIQGLFGCKVAADRQMILPFEFFRTTDLHNVYTDFIRAVCFKLKCDVLIDAYSNALLPFVDFTYIHYPFFGHLQTQRPSANIAGRIKNRYYLPYSFWEKGPAKKRRRVVFANSTYTMNAVERIVGITPILLYPPIMRTFFNHDLSSQRTNTVVSVARISPEKRFTLIPQIAKMTDKRIHFLIVGISESPNELGRIMTLIEKCQVSDRVKVVTNVSREELQKILRTSKVLFHPAEGEHFGVSIVEGMASGCIPIVHNSGGPKEFVPRPFRFNELAEAAKNIENVVLDWSPQLARRFVQVAESFSEEHFTERFLEIFNRYVEKS